MNRTAFVFPGQGSQQVGMGLDLVREHPDLLDTYYRAADEILGFPLSGLCWEGPKEALRDTAVTQPAIFLTSVVTSEVLRRHDIVPDAVAGHSLGEYPALVAAGVLDWTDALRLVRLRGELMAAVNERVPGGMAAVMGLDPDAVERLCADASAATGETVEIANDNEPTQTVVSGRPGAVEHLAELANRAGARKVIMLDVGAPFHCSLMRGMEAEFADALSATDFRDPAVPMYSSVTADRVRTAAEVVVALRRQLTGRVRWTETVNRMVDMGLDGFVEVGPGKVLSGLCRRIAPQVSVHQTSDMARIRRTAESRALTTPATP
ncbi:ACP S-malonyltransferase [Streptomyces sparsus]